MIVVDNEPINACISFHSMETFPANVALHRAVVLSATMQAAYHDCDHRRYYYFYYRVNGHIVDVDTSDKAIANNRNKCHPSNSLTCLGYCNATFWQSVKQSKVSIDR